MQLLGERTEVLTDPDEIRRVAIQAFSNSVHRRDICTDSSGPAVVMTIEWLRRCYLEASARGVKIRFLTEITRDNLQYCRQIMGFAELRHLDGVQGNFGLNETEYMAAGVMDRKKYGDSLVQSIIYSNVEQIVGQQQYIFETLWQNSVPGEQKMLEIENGLEPEKVQVFYGAENTTSALVKWLAGARASFEGLGDSLAPSVVMGIDAFKSEYVRMKERGVRARWVTEITKENLPYCKELMKYVDVRHLDGIRGNFGVTDGEYATGATIGGGGARPLPVVIVSNSRVFIEQSRFLFETLWGKAVPAEQRIRELEEGAPVETTLPIEGAENVLRAMLAMRANAKKRVDIYMHANGVSLTAGMDQLREGLPKLKERGVRVRYLTEITKDNLQYCKQLAALAAMEMRHTTGLKGNFGINETEYITIDPFIGGELPARGLYSNNRVMVYQQQQYFDTLWQRATPAQERMREIEEGVEPEFIEIINDGVRAAELMMDFARSVRKEAQLILPSPKTMARTEKLGVWNLLVDAANSHGAEIRIITPITEENAALARQITDRAPGIKMLKGPASATGLFVQDGKRYFRAEYRNPDAGEVAEAISRVVYSNSASGVKSFKSIFETLWKQSELYEALRVANEKLVLQDRMQKEFINIAAHELRTPIQPILGVANLKAAEFADGKEEAASITKTEMEIISRNAKRLQRLSSDILEMARIEGGQFRLNVEEFDLDDVILPLVQDAQSEASSSGKALKISYSAPLARRGHLVLKGDKGRITEVIWNLLNNAIKFSESGTISISAEKGNIDGGPVAVVTVRDTGRGIDPDILPRLFGKFVTKSDKGTGLGLYISKSIVEAHGGKIWAQNNADGKGATFTFTLPLG